MSITAELHKDNDLSCSQLIAKQVRANMPTEGIPLDPFVVPEPPNMTGGSNELKLVPDEERAASDSTNLEIAVIRILWGV